MWLKNSNNMKKLLSLFLLLGAELMNSQPPDRFYTKYGGQGIDIGYGVQEIYKRQYIVVGSTSSYGNGGSDVYLLLVDSMAAIVWHKTFGGLGADVGKSVLMNPADSGFVICGYTNSFGNGGYDVYVVRTDKAGDLKWQATFGGLDWDFGSDLAFAPDGNLIICGNTYNSPYGKNEGYVMKVNIATGALIKEKKYGGAGDDEFNRIRPLSDGSFGLSGNTKSYSDPNNDFWFFKIDNNCDSLTSKALGTANKGERCYDFMEDKSSNLVFCGSYDTSFYNTGKNISYLIKTDLNGSVISDFKVSGVANTDNAMFSSVTTAKQGTDYFLTSKFYFSAIFKDELLPYLISDSYIFLQATTYGDVGDDISFRSIHTSDNGFLVVGYSLGQNQSTSDIFLLKLDNTIVGTNPYVGLNEQEPQRDVFSKIYFFENHVYLDNKRAEGLTFEIFNSQGKLIQSGKTYESSIPVPHLQKDIYLIRILERPELRTKFIRN